MLAFCSSDKQIESRTIRMENIPAEFWTFLGGLISGAIGGSLITLSVKKNQTVKGSGTNTDQSGATAGGDIVGRDKK